MGTLNSEVRWWLSVDIRTKSSAEKKERRYTSSCKCIIYKIFNTTLLHDVRINYWFDMFRSQLLAIFREVAIILCVQQRKTGEFPEDG